MTKLAPWADYVDLLKPGEDLLKQLWRPEDEAYRADFYRQMMMNLAYAYFQYFQSNDEHPEFMPLWNSVFLLQPNPDDVYYFATLDGRRRYRVVGDRGTIHMVNFLFGCGMMGMVAEPGDANISYLDNKDIQVDENGKFEILLAAERPANFKGTFHKLREDVDYLIVRNRSYDWGNETDARMAIECLDAPLVKRRMSIAEIDERLRSALTLTERLSGLFFKLQNNTLERVGWNKFELNTYSGIGLPHQYYWTAAFQVEKDEALILETPIPDVCPYWNVQMNDPYFNAVEFVYRQTSLNGHTAKIDSDGKFRAVIAHTDPGVPNWLDTGGFVDGTIFGRWTQCDSAPVPDLKRVKLSEVRQYLPSETPIVPTEERLELLRKRRLGAQLRRRW